MTVNRYASTNPANGEATSAMTTGTTEPHFTEPHPIGDDAHPDQGADQSM